MSWTTIIALLLVILLFLGGACFNIFIEMFRSEISDYIKACAETKRCRKKQIEVIEKALDKWPKDSNPFFQEAGSHDNHKQD